MLVKTSFKHHFLTPHFKKNVKKTETKTTKQFHPLVSFNNTPHTQELESKFPSVHCKLRHCKGNDKASPKWPEYWFIFICFYLWRLEILSSDIKSLRLVKVAAHIWEPAAIQKVQYVCYRAGTWNPCPLWSVMCVLHDRKTSGWSKLNMNCIL